MAAQSAHGPGPAGTSLQAVMSWANRKTPGIPKGLTGTDPQQLESAGRPPDTDFPEDPMTAVATRPETEQAQRDPRDPDVR
ncbi:hypothetical protein AB0L13_36305, partial [Saccharopolyspora shandongensis]|uniref:hypothetical protein n=1 Tax=Saccharopolyspora shandongensis TaxID=418495 RepID=UPI0034358474